MNFQIVIDALTKIITDIINFIPNLINGLIILLVGVLIARLVRWVIYTVLLRLRFDPLVERVGITGALRGLGVALPLSRIIAQLVWALLLLSFLITATRLMGLEAVARLLEQLLQFLPNIIAAAIVFVLGGIAAQFIGGLVGSAATASGIAGGGRVGRIVQHLISLFVVIVALGQLGLDTAILVTALTIAIAAFGLALGLGLGLGARGIVQHILAGFYLRQRLPAGQPIEFKGGQGQVSGVGSVNTIVDTAAGRVIVPNNALLEATLRVPASPPMPAPPRDPAA